MGGMRLAKCERCDGELEGTQSYWCLSCENKEIAAQRYDEEYHVLREAAADTVTGSLSIAEYNRMESEA